MKKHLLSYLLLFLFSLLCLGCAKSDSFNSSMDYDPGWDNDENRVQSFDELPRHKNELERGVK